MQFGLTTIYHFPFIPITIGMATATTVFQTAWYPTPKVTYLHLTRFFGMNGSTYSRFIGDVFGAPLAMEGLLALLEATLIGLWIFGSDTLPRGIQLATIWIPAAGTILSV